MFFAVFDQQADVTLFDRRQITEPQKLLRSANLFFVGPFDLDVVSQVWNFVQLNQALAQPPAFPTFLETQKLHVTQRLKQLDT